MSKYFLQYCIYFCLCFFLFFSTSCKNDANYIASLNNKKQTVKEITKGVESFYSQSGNMKAFLTAPLMVREQTDSTYIEFPKSLHADFFNDSTRVKETWLDSKYGKYFESLNMVYLRDSVVIITSKGDTLRSSDMWWDQTKGIFYTHKPAYYNGVGGQKLIGTHGMEATQDLKTISFMKPDKGVLLYKE